MRSLGLGFNIYLSRSIPALEMLNTYGKLI